MRITVLTIFACVGAVMAQASAQTWGTATSTHATDGRVIVFRYIDTFAKGFEKESQPSRAIIQWKYSVESDKGMPTVEERQRMNAFEDLLEPDIEEGGFATLALVSTGENLREWIYYSRDEGEFMKRLNRALGGHPRFPIEVLLAADPQWDIYEEFKRGLAQGQ